MKCAVVIGHHPNAQGQDRGTRHLSFRAHARFKMERWEGSEETWLVAEKQRGGAKLAMELMLVPRGESVVFERVRELTTEEFNREAKKRLADAQEDRRRQQTEARRELSPELLEEVFSRLPVEGDGEGWSKTKAAEAISGKTDNVKRALEQLVGDGRVIQKPGPHRGLYHWTKK